jgi:hypothetical protein
MADFPLDIQLDVDSEHNDLPAIAHQWFDELSSRIIPQARGQLAGLPAHVGKAGQRSSRLGEPGDLFGIVSIDRFPADGLPTSAERNASDEGLRWLRSELTKLPTAASVWFGRLDERGHRSGRLFTAGVRTLEGSPGWLQLYSHVDSSAFLSAESEALENRWLETLSSIADRTNPGFGHVSYYYHDGATALEDSLQPREHPQEQWDPRFSIGLSRTYLRGYSWLTIVAQELADRLGGVDVLVKSGAFAEVRQLQNGGVWLLATERFAEYDRHHAAEVFRALAPTIRAGSPRKPQVVFETPPDLLVYEDPSRLHDHQ